MKRELCKPLTLVRTDNGIKVLVVEVFGEFARIAYGGHPAGPKAVVKIKHLKPISEKWP